MTKHELRQALNAMSEQQFEMFRQRYGGDKNLTRERYVDHFIREEATAEPLIAEILDFPTEAERRQQAALQPKTVNQNIGSIGQVGALAGRDAQGSVTISVMTVHRLFEELERRIAADTTISEPEKESLLQRIKEMATSPKLVEYVTAILKGWWGGELGYNNGA